MNSQNTSEVRNRGRALLLLATALAGGCSGGEGAPAASATGAAGGGSDSTLFSRVKADAPEWHAENLKRREAEGDDWRGEALFNLAKPAFQEFLHAVLVGSDDEVAFLLADGFTTSELRPARLESVYDSAGTRVLRGVPGEERYGVAELRRKVSELTESFADPASVHPHFKMVGVEEGTTQTLETTLILHLDGEGEGGRLVQQNMEMKADFHVQDQEAHLSALTLSAFEEVSAERALFRELSGHVFEGIPRFKEDFLWGIPEHRYHTDILSGRHFTGMQGLALGDVNGDGLDDLYVSQQGGLANRLFLREPDGTVSDFSLPSGLAVRDGTRSALIVDFDNDGDQDVAFSINTAIVVAYNDGTARFTGTSTMLLDGVADVYSMCAADPDVDGDLDLYACRWSLNRSAMSTDSPPLPYHDANNGARNYFWRQEADGKFVDATEDVGLGQNNTRFSYAAVWDDLDGDDDLDLYVANDFGRNNLYVNEEGRFRDVAGERNAEDKSSGMGVTIGDYDLDGDQDIYVSNMFSSAGQRIVPQYSQREKDGLIADHFQFAVGNTLLQNKGDGSFEDVSKVAGVTIGGWAWGAKFLDVNNDGYPEIYSPDGYITNDDPHDL